MKILLSGILSLGWLLLANPAIAQYEVAKFGKITKAELAMTECAFEPEASAMVLFRDSKTEMNFSASGLAVKETVHVRVKVFDEDGTGAATRTFTFPKRIRIAGVKGATYNLTNGSVEETKLEKEHRFQEVIDRNTIRLTYTFPQVRAGSVIDLKFRVEYGEYYHIPTRYFQDYGMPIGFATAEYQFPGDFVFTEDLYRLGFPRVERRHTQPQMGTVAMENFVYSFSEVPSFEKEEYVKNQNDNRYQVRWNLQGVRFTNRPFYNLADWEKFAEYFYNNDLWGWHLKRHGYLKQDAEAIAAAYQDPTERAKHAYSFIMKKMVWNGEYDDFPDDHFVKTYETGTASSATVNFHLHNLMAELGLEVSPVLVSTEGNGRPNVMVPGYSDYDHVVVAWESPEGRVLLDASHHYTPFGSLPAKVSNGVGIMVVNDKITQQVILPEEGLQLEIMAKIWFEDGQMRCDENVKLKGPARQRMAKLIESNPDRLMELTNEDLAGWTCVELTHPDIELIEEDAMATFSYQGESYKAEDDFIIFNPFITKLWDENPFQEEQRFSPVEFEGTKKMRCMVFVEVPEGFEPDALPEPLKVVLGQGDGSCIFSVTNMNGRLNIVFMLEIKRALFSIEEYEMLRNFASYVMAKQNVEIVLKRKTS